MPVAGGVRGVGGAECVGCERCQLAACEAVKGSEACRLGVGSATRVLLMPRTGDKVSLHSSTAAALHLTPQTCTPSDSRAPTRLKHPLQPRLLQPAQRAHVRRGHGAAKRHAGIQQPPRRVPGEGGGCGGGGGGGQRGARGQWGRGLRCMRGVCAYGVSVCMCVCMCVCVCEQAARARGRGMRVQWGWKNETQVFGWQACASSPCSGYRPALFQS